MGFPENLRRIRQEQRYSQAALGRLAGLTQATISRLEAGSEAPFGATVSKLALALGVEPSVLAMPDELNERKRRQPS